MNFLTIEEYVTERVCEMANLEVEKISILMGSSQNLDENIYKILNGEKENVCLVDDILEQIEKVKMLDEKIKLIDLEIKMTLAKLKMSKKEIIVVD